MGDLYQYLFEHLALWQLLKAAKYPLILTGVSMPLAILFGLLLALMRMSRRPWLKYPAGAYIEVIRGTPLLVQLFLIWYSLPLIGQRLGTELLTFKEPLYCGIFCLAANYAAYQAEILRAGLEAVDKGQREAALSLGFTERQSLVIVVIPQAFRIVVPPIINDFIAMLKDSCLCSVISVPELLTRAQGIGKTKGNLAEMYIAASVLYMLMSLSFYLLGRWLERRLRLKGAPELHSDPTHGH